MAFDLSRINARLERIPRGFEGKVSQIGIPKGFAYEDGTPVAYVAAIQEFGAPEVGIPPRSFFRPAVKAKAGNWSALLRGLVKRVGEGQMTATEALDAVGVVAATDIQTEIAMTYSPALSPVTVLLRKWRKAGRKITGRTVGEAAAAIAAGVDPGSDNKPLNDTGLLIASITSRVGNGSEGFVK
ncbi:MAG: hypothetical protein KGH75_02690 [Rhodospirillales bacterium]|nr:hypothetical protein [Rhodospirillales bacterium]